MSSIQQNFQTAVLTYEPNEIRSIQKTKVQVFSVWNEQLINNSFTVKLPGICWKISREMSEKNANMRKMT